MPVATYVPDALVLGIGLQTGKGVVNPDAVNWVDLITGPADATNATGILLRNRADLSKALERIESDGGTVPGGLSRLTGVKTRISAALSFTIDAMGNRGTATAGTPVAGDFPLDEYMIQILEGARMKELLAGAAGTTYEFSATAKEYKTIKVWRGFRDDAGNEEAFIFSDCQINLTFNFTAGEKATITCDVIVGQVDHNIASTFPDNALNDLNAAFGNQILAAPVLERAGATLGGVVRGFQTGTLAITVPEQTFPDSNITGGIDTDTGSPRDVTFDATWFVDTASDDFGLLEDDLDGAGPVMEFTLGQDAVASGLVNALKFSVSHLRATTTDKADADSGDKVLRTISGYAAIGSGGTTNQEFILEAV
jgi:hypothetical protein